MILSARPNTADSVMTASYSFGTANNIDLNNTMSQLDMTKSLTENFTSDLMTRSLDPSLLDTSAMSISTVSEISEIPITKTVNNGNFYNEQPIVTTQFPMVTASV